MKYFVEFLIKFLLIMAVMLVTLVVGNITGDYQQTVIIFILVWMINLSFGLHKMDREINKVLENQENQNRLIRKSKQ